MLAYGPISSTASLDPALLTNYATNHAINRFPTFLPLLVPAAIFVIPYTDLMFAIIRRTRAGRPVMAADRQHLHHRLLNIGHSYRQSVLIMYLWAALFSVTVVSLSVVRSRLVVLEAATIIAVLTLLPVTMPRLRPWRSGAARTPPAGRRPAAAPAHAAALSQAGPGAPGARRRRAAGPEVTRPARSPRDAPPLSPVTRTQPPALTPPPPSVLASPPGPVFHAAPAPATPAIPADLPWFTASGYRADAPRVLGEPLPRAGRLPETEPAYPADPQDPFPGPGWRPGPSDVPDPLPHAPRRDLRPWLRPRSGLLVTVFYPAFTFPGRLAQPQSAAGLLWPASAGRWS